ncbi:DUF1642 domain-containing protein [Lactiplantibacillus paraxiangfangensis]|uniref:DUF1642 domain-containing protein n=1 Tax=Lactiplantibacillus paraxiangfangensis TaxID=3076224 RepID=UPI0030C76134
MIRIYRKTATIKAEQFDGSDEMADCWQLDWRDDHYCAYPTYAKGRVTVRYGDWLVQDDRELSIWEADAFKQAYAELPVISRYVADIIEDYKSNHDMGALMYVATHGKLDDGDWIFENMETVCRAWLDGYQVEESE